MIRRTGGFNPRIKYSEDSELMFRLATLTGFCYVNRPLVKFDRSPVQLRHTGVSAEWNRTDFFLQHNQLRLEGLMRISEPLPTKIRQLIRKQLGSVHNGWANWYLSIGQYRKAREAVSRAMQLGPTFNIAMKWLLMLTSPQLARWAVRYRQERSPESIA
jgi:hypothetical protein